MRFLQVFRLGQEASGTELEDSLSLSSCGDERSSLSFNNVRAHDGPDRQEGGFRSPYLQPQANGAKRLDAIVHVALAFFSAYLLWTSGEIVRGTWIR